MKPFIEYHKNWLIWILGIAMLLSMCSSCHADIQEMDLTKAVIHHTASGDVSAETIDRWHKQRGWDGIGYHYIIRKDGTVEKGRGLHKAGAHAKGRNHYIGIALTGNEVFSPEQLRELVVLLKQLEVRNIFRHHERCPGKGLDVEKIQEGLK